MSLELKLVLLAVSIATLPVAQRVCSNILKRILHHSTLDREVSPEKLIPFRLDLTLAGLFMIGGISDSGIHNDLLFAGGLIHFSRAYLHLLTMSEHSNYSADAK
jgi:hypothetical protein